MQVPGRSHRALRAMFALGAMLAFARIACSPLENALATVIVKAPRRGSPAPAEPELGEVRVAVGPPAATLSLAVVDPPERAKATVFVLHGIRGSKVESGMRIWSEMLTAAGFRVILVDLRGHGRSTGDDLSYGVLESRDLAQVLDAVEARGLRIGSVGVMGNSYGAAAALEWAGRDARVHAVVAVSPFASLRSVVPAYAVLPLPSGFVNEVIDRGGQQGHFDPDEASPVVAITHTTSPVLLIHGEDDRRIPSAHSQQIFAAGKEHAELVLVPGAGHRSIVEHPLLRERATSWFARYLL
ncbi:alpha/beta fold hydrolase [Pendulispora rubella]|uniref:Alpha/beta fold hydrolase n=1 Tax=Pendulispora rubella TaxID=2741070 RepID=A0ABZ2KU56_9BACT